MTTSRRTLGLIAASAGLLLALSACTTTPTPPPAETTTAKPTPSEEPPAAPEPLGPREPSLNLGAPWSVAFVRNSALVSERDSARLLELTEDGETREVATIAGVVHGGEGGLLGLAVSPAGEGEQPEFLYAYSTGAEGNRVQRFPITGEPGSLAIGDPTPIIEGIPSAASHNGGRIAFGPDGMLYVTAGDAGNPSNGQDLGTLAGKILRVTPDGGVPADNPFDGNAVYSYGHRNPQGIAWAADGTMYSSEFGQDTWDELNVITAGANYGWPTVEGIASDERFVDPVQQWRPADASPSGIAIAGDTIYIANLRGQRVRTVPLADLAASQDHFVEEYGRIRDVVVSPDGKLWLLSNNTDGRVEPRENDDRFIDSGLVE